MFDILSEEIYSGDVHVFLRELLQNSIDAIRMRRAILERQGLSPLGFGLIRVDVRPESSGDALITFRDDGIGMDEYIIRNYLAVAGKSYYRSKDFERLGLPMDPLSRFGVGILSCFIVADRIEIETRRDPYLSPAPPLKIAIPAVQRRFRMEQLPAEGFGVGTLIRVYVDGRRFGKNTTRASRELDVAGYLSAIAGFVDLPIAVTEGERRVLIVHPECNPEPILRVIGDGYVVRQIELALDWSKVFEPQDAATARDLLSQRCYDIERDLGITGWEGKIVNFRLNKPTTRVLDVESDKIYLGEADEEEERPLRLRGSWSRADPNVPPTAAYPERLAVFRDGILLSNLPMPSRFDDAPFRIRLNFRRPGETNVNLARTTLLEENEEWSRQLRSAFVRAAIGAHASQFIALNPSERFLALGRELSLGRIEPSELLEWFPAKYVPIPLVGRHGRFEVVDWEQLERAAVPGPPEVIEGILEAPNKGMWRPGLLKHWKGGPFVVDQMFGWGELGSICEVVAGLLREKHSKAVVRFLYSSIANTPAMVQPIWLPCEDDSGNVTTFEDTLTKAMSDLSGLTRGDLAKLNNEEEDFFRTFWFVDFEAPYGSMAWAPPYVNRKHGVGEVLIRVFGRCLLSTELDADARRGAFQDLLGEVRHHGGTAEGLTSKLRWFEVKVRELGLLENSESLAIDEDSIVPARYSFAVGEDWVAQPSFGKPIRRRPRTGTYRP